MQALPSLPMLSLMLLNLLGGVISGIWLAVLGEWWAIGYGFAVVFAGTYGIGLLTIPGGILFGVLAASFHESGKPVAVYFSAALSFAYAFFVVSAWCLCVFYGFMSQADAETFWPLLVWSYGVALYPLERMASKPQLDEYGSAVTAFFARIAYIATAVVAIFVPMRLFEFGEIFGGLMTQVFGGVMAIGLLVQLASAIIVMREGKRQENSSDH